MSFHLHCGEIAALIGPNGAGKSSLFRSILGQMPYSGTITFSPAGGPAVRLSDGANAPLAARGTRPLIGYVPQSPSFDRGDPISVLDFFTAATSKWPVCLPIPQKYRERCRMSLERVHGGDLLDKPMGALSRGQLQRVLLAVATLPQPDLLILDEPVSGVDNEGLRRFYEMLEQLRRLGMAVAHQKRTHPNTNQKQHSQQIEQPVPPAGVGSGKKKSLRYSLSHLDRVGKGLLSRLFLLLLGQNLVQISGCKRHGHPLPFLAFPRQ